jgi:hypothetical protein
MLRPNHSLKLMATKIVATGSNYGVLFRSRDGLR